VKAKYTYTEWLVLTAHLPASTFMLFHLTELIFIAPKYAFLHNRHKDV